MLSRTNEAPSAANATVLLPIMEVNALGKLPPTDKETWVSDHGNDEDMDAEVNNA